MMNKYLLIVLLVFSTRILIAQSYDPTPGNLANRKLFQDMHFGMFIHWGPFSILGSGEWVMNNQNITVKNYTLLKDFFNPIDFNAAAYVSAAKNAGMKYITLVTRHHDGFSMWDTRYSDFNIMQTPYKKDVVKEIAIECHKQGVKLVLYYSLLDWRRDDYSYWTGNTGHGSGRVKRGNWMDYIKFMKNQLTELLTNYGEIEGIWFDGYWDQIKKGESKAQVNWHTGEIYDLIHKLQPSCLIGNNHHISPLSGEDFQMFEKDLPGNNTTGFGKADISALPLETCETMNKSWGFNITDTSYKSTKEIIHYIVNAAAANANFLLNIGPMPNGRIQSEFIDTLYQIGLWMQKNGETIYGTRGNVISKQEWGGITLKNRTLYVHVLNPPANGVLNIPINFKVYKASIFGSKNALQFHQLVNKNIVIDLNKDQIDKIDTIIQLEL